MTQVNYSEFSYGYAFTENLIRDSGQRPTQAPRFPTLREEARLGYDMKIHLPARVLFIQYKRPECMVSTAAREISRLQIRDLPVPFFRMPIMKGMRSDQHDRLLDLEEKNADSVFYATPALHDVYEFNLAYGATRVHHESFFFSPKAIGRLPVHESHHIAYAKRMNHGWLCSEPEPIKAQRYDDIEESVLGSLRDESEPPHTPITPLTRPSEAPALADAAQRVRDELGSIVPPALRETSALLEERIIERIDKSETKAHDEPDVFQVILNLLVAREIARVILDLDMHVAQAP